jgi:hypothetical protein
MHVRMAFVAEIDAPAHVFTAEVLLEPFVGVAGSRDEVMERQRPCPSTQLTLPYSVLYGHCSMIVSRLPRVRKPGYGLAALPSTERNLPDMAGNPPSIDDNLPSADGNPPTIDGNHPSADGNHPTIDGNHPTIDGNHPSTDGNLPGVEGNHPSADDNLPGIDGNLPSMEGDLPSTVGEPCRYLAFPDSLMRKL